MSLSEYKRAKISAFGGEWNRTDIAKIPYPNALIALNCEFAPGEVRERKGFGPIALAYNIRSMYLATLPAGAYLLFFGAAHSLDTFRIYALQLVAGGSLATFYDLGASDGIGAVWAPVGAYIAMAPFDYDFKGADSGKILNFTTGTFADDAFSGPLTDTPTITTPAAGGVVTAGLHGIGYLIQSRSGFTGKVSPVNGSTQELLLSAANVTAGDKIDFSMTFTVPSDAALIYPVLTTVTNLDRLYIVPNAAPISLTPGATPTVHWVIDISDADLVLGTDVTDNEFLLTQTSSDVAPFFPFSVGAYGSRTVWLAATSTESLAYISEPSQPQVLTADQHALHLPGGRLMRCQGVGGRTLYILGPHWTYGFEDTGEVPVLWPEPRLVDGTIGTLSPHGFTIDASTGVGWCAHTSGLYYFTGSAFAQIPISYYSHGSWGRINWATGRAGSTTLPRSHQVMVLDDKTHTRVIVVCALDLKGIVNTSGTAVTLVSGDRFPLSGPTGTATLTNNIIINGVFYTITSVTDQTHCTLSSSAGTQTGVSMLASFPYPTHLLVYDYSEGVTPGKVKYSQWQIKTFVPGAICAVAGPSQDDHNEVWLGEWYAASGSEKILRQMGTVFDASPYNDNSLAINFQYETADMPGDIDLGAVYHHYAQTLRATGSGALSRTLYGLDRASSVTIPDVTLGTAPGRLYTNRFPLLRSESASVRLFMNTANSYCIISGLEHFYGLGPRFRAA